MLVSTLVNGDPAFATDVSQNAEADQHSNQLHRRGIDPLHGIVGHRTFRKSAGRRQRKETTKATANLTATTAPTIGTNKGKGKSKGKDDNKGKNQNKGSGKGKGARTYDARPICPEYLTDPGCQKEDQCTMRHPPRTEECLRCGATGHTLLNCRRPRRDAPSSAARPRGKAKTGAKGKAKPKLKAQAGNVEWLEDMMEEEEDMRLRNKKSIQDNMHQHAPSLPLTTSFPLVA